VNVAGLQRDTIYRLLLKVSFILQGK